jgi:hypothetical protein
MADIVQRDNIKDNDVLCSKDKTERKHGNAILEEIMRDQAKLYQYWQKQKNKKGSKIKRGEIIANIIASMNSSRFINIEKGRSYGIIVTDKKQLHDKVAHKMRTFLKNHPTENNNNNNYNVLLQSIVNTKNDTVDTKNVPDSDSKRGLDIYGELDELLADSRENDDDSYASNGAMNIVDDVNRHENPAPPTYTDVATTTTTSNIQLHNVNTDRQIQGLSLPNTVSFHTSTPLLPNYTHLQKNDEYKKELMSLLALQQKYYNEMVRDHYR